ncbi:MAG TPA: cytochrome c3 family protein [Terriglobia bacterium]|nr:cytochrome c3 family protein [Terriglobia bacterium]
MRGWALGVAVVLWGFSAAPASAQKDSCVACHSNLPGEYGRPAKLFSSDIHHQAGLSCADCHGGDRTDDSMNAMSPAKGFRGVPAKAQVPQFCGRCHSDPSYMRKFNPSLRTDQVSEYFTSVHGKRLKQGDTKVAVCVDCHSVHDIRAPSDPRASVYPTNVAETCAHCHADANYMKGYKIPTNQYALYEKSVHAAAIAGGDTSAPTCSTCHGNHGATPPGVSSVANVCGTCHAMNEQLFEKSPHGAAFARMGLPGCVQCHSNHEILKPTDALVGTGPKAICVTCHVKGDNGYNTAQKISEGLDNLKAGYQKADQALDTAEKSGMEVSPAKVELTSAHSDLIKARVAVHSFNAADVLKITNQGVEISHKAYEAGIAALHERDYRRKGLAVALIAIVIAMSGLYFKIRRSERG